MKLVITHKFDRAKMLTIQVTGVEIDTMTNTLSYVPKEDSNKLETVQMDTSNYYRIEHK